MGISYKSPSRVVAAEENLDAAIPFHATAGKDTSCRVHRAVLLLFDSGIEDVTVFRGADVDPAHNYAQSEQDDFHDASDVAVTGSFQGTGSANDAIEYNATPKRPGARISQFDQISAEKWNLGSGHSGGRKETERKPCRCSVPICF